jgi:hypothetical protein
VSQVAAFRAPLRWPLPLFLADLAMFLGAASLILFEGPPSLARNAGAIALGMTCVTVSWTLPPAAMRFLRTSNQVFVFNLAILAVAWGPSLVMHGSASAHLWQPYSLIAQLSFWGVLVADIKRCNRQRPSSSTGLVLPPGTRLRALLSFVFAPRTMDRVFDAVLADVQVEWIIHNQRVRSPRRGPAAGDHVEWGRTALVG